MLPPASPINRMIVATSQKQGRHKMDRRRKRRTKNKWRPRREQMRRGWRKEGRVEVRKKGAAGVRVPVKGARREGHVHVREQPPPLLLLAVLHRGTFPFLFFFFCLAIDYINLALESVDVMLVIEVHILVTVFGRMYIIVNIFFLSYFTTGHVCVMYFCHFDFHALFRIQCYHYVKICFEASIKAQR